jgi:small subunit ribosomal protein S16
MVKIRLRRMGAKKQPTYRFIVCDAKSPRDGAFIEILGHYNPRTEPKTVVVNQEKVKAWLAKGAQPSDPVRRLFAELGLVERAPIYAKKAASVAAPAAAAE